jgi:signal transduction histidine kinase
LYAGGVVRSAVIRETWLAWWLGDAIGALVVAPPLLVWASEPSRAQPSHAAELLALVCALLAACAAVFGMAAASSPLRQPFILVAIPIWAALRFGQRGTTSTTFAMAALAVTATALGRGPFAGHPLSAGLALLQVFVASVAVTGLLLSAAISERQARSDELARVNVELSNALRARDTFLSVASHELKTPLSALRLQSDVLLRMRRDVPKSMTEHLQRIDRQVDRLDKLIVELLEVSRIDAGRLELEPERIELTELVREVAQRFEEQARKAGSALRVAAAGRIFGDWDPLRLDQVISNLLSNAIKYGDGKPIEIEASSADGVARVRVRDQGLGIAPADQARVFDRFERGTPPRKVEGFGLGLWICKQIVDAMGGRIAVSSAIGAGSTFEVELPGAEAEAALGPAAPPPHRADEVLVAENDKDKTPASSP